MRSLPYFLWEVNPTLIPCGEHPCSPMTHTAGSHGEWERTAAPNIAKTPSGADPLLERLDLVEPDFNWNAISTMVDSLVGKVEHTSRATWRKGYMNGVMTLSSLARSYVHRHLRDDLALARSHRQEGVQPRLESISSARHDNQYLVRPLLCSRPHWARHVEEDINSVHCVHCVRQVGG
jgi:hypothetical protein